MIFGVLGLHGGDTLQTILISIIELYLLVMIGYAVLTLVPSRPALPMVEIEVRPRAARGADRGPVRRLLPQTSLPIDLAFLIVFFGLQILVVPAVERLT